MKSRKTFEKCALAAGMYAGRLLALLAMVLSWGCATTAERQYRAREEEQIREAVLLESLKSRATNRVIFVAFQDASRKWLDPSDAVIARLQAAGIPAQRASVAGRDAHTQVIDKTTGQLGIIYYAGVLRWRSHYKVEVSEGLCVASLGGGFSDFIMEKKDGKWVRVKTKRIITI